MSFYQIVIVGVTGWAPETQDLKTQDASKEKKLPGCRARAESGRIVSVIQGAL